MEDGYIVISVVDPINYLPAKGIKYTFTCGPASGAGVSSGQGKITIDHGCKGQSLEMSLQNIISGELEKLPSIPIKFDKASIQIVAPYKKYDFPTKKHNGEPAKEDSANSLPEQRKEGTLTLQEFLDNYCPCVLGEEVIHTRDKSGKPIVKVCSIGDRVINYPQKGIADSDFDNAAKELDLEVEIVKTFYNVEASGKGFLPSGIPKILYERHVVFKRSGGKDNKINTEENHELSCSKGYFQPKDYTKSEWKSIPKTDKYQDGIGSWVRFCKASRKGYSVETIAQSVSWGGFQVMGFNYKSCGFDSAIELADECFKSESAHLKLFVAYCKGNTELKKALKGKEWAKAARIYNGPRYELNKYDKKLEKQYNELKKLTSSKTSLSDKK
ncbi:N-acetylmuramidase family protein [Chromobacterium amazonense]|uniref:N-acetylmuramidase family protein n=1 Tax=Chromobacterium amazonense TaxID=1382803 RepID=UPI0009F22960|nr:N-acetylmuramidase family protein [Chromobacterium amazonense]